MIFVICHMIFLVALIVTALRRCTRSLGLVSNNNCDDDDVHLGPWRATSSRAREELHRSHEGLRKDIHNLRALRTQVKAQLQDLKKLAPSKCKEEG